MRLCRFEFGGVTQVGFYREDSILPLGRVAQAVGLSWPDGDALLPLLTAGKGRDAVVDLQSRIAGMMDEELFALSVDVSEVQLRVPIPQPGKLMLLAGNYSKHIEEGGGRAEERERTFPYVFMKPPATTLTDPDAPIRIPSVSPDHVDWELELGVIIGKTCRHVSEDDALQYVAGYTVVNDVSDRKYRPNPGRAERPKDTFFDWLHGKWHDTFCPMGPCVLAADETPDPQSFDLELRVNGEVEQSATTGDMVFPVSAIVSFISQSVTLHPGDIISTGTPSGVGAPKGKFLKPGDTVEAEIAQIGCLSNPVLAEE